MFWRRSREDRVSLDAVARLLDAARGIFEAGVEASKVPVGMLPQATLTPETAAEADEQLGAAGVELLGRLRAGDKDAEWLSA